MRISDWSSDVCSSDLVALPRHGLHKHRGGGARGHRARVLTFGQYAFDIGIEENPLGLDVQRDFDALRLLLAADVEPADAHQRIDEQQREVEDDLHRRLRQRLDRKGLVTGKSVSVRVDLGCRRIIKKKYMTSISP